MSAVAHIDAGRADYVHDYGVPVREDVQQRAAEQADAEIVEAMDSVVGKYGDRAAHEHGGSPAERQHAAARAERDYMHDMLGQIIEQAHRNPHDRHGLMREVLRQRDAIRDAFIEQAEADADVAERAA